MRVQLNTKISPQKVSAGFSPSFSFARIRGHNSTSEDAPAGRPWKGRRECLKTGREAPHHQSVSQSIYLVININAC